MQIQAAGTDVYYELRPGRGPRVLLLHGWGCSSGLMKPVADRLPEECQTLSVDFPGHGSSGRPPEPWGVPEYAACLREVLEKLDFCPCTVIAHSFGARVAIWLASGENSPFTRMILTGAAGIRKPPTPQSRKRAAAYQRLKRLILPLKKVPPLRGLAGSLEEKLRKKYGSADYNALDAEMRKTFVRVVQQDLSDRLGSIRVPTLLIFGENDTETPLWMGKKMEESIPDAGLVTLQGGTHFAYLEQLNTFMVIVERFLTEE